VSRVRPAIRAFALVLVALLASLCWIGPGAGAQGGTPATLAYPIYQNGLAPGWENYSWGSTVDLSAAAPGDPARHVIALTVTQPYGALHLHRDSAMDPAEYLALRFDLQAGGPEQVFTMVLYDENERQIGKPLPISRFGGLPQPGAWKTYLIPLGHGGLDAIGHMQRSIVIQSDSGHAEPTVYVRDLGLTGGSPLPPSTQPVTTATVHPPARDHKAGDRLYLGLTVAVISLTLWAAIRTIQIDEEPAGRSEELFEPFSRDRYTRPPVFR
jgi:hypothetical protein